MDTKKKFLSKIDEINKYLDELNKLDIASLSSFEDYASSVEKKRASERVLQILIEVIVDISYLIYKYKKIGIPKDDDSIIEILYQKKIINKEIKELILKLKSFRNILVHRYGVIDDELVFENLTENISDFEKLRDYFLKLL